MAITREPKNIDTKNVTNVSERKIRDFINKGGKPTSKQSSELSETPTKSIKLILSREEMETIKKLRNMRPAPRGRKIPISVHDWVIEAIQEKIKREARKYDLPK